MDMKVSTYCDTAVVTGVESLKGTYKVIWARRRSDLRTYSCGATALAACFAPQHARASELVQGRRTHGCLVCRVVGSPIIAKELR